MPTPKFRIEHDPGVTDMHLPADISVGVEGSSTLDVIVAIDAILQPGWRAAYGDDFPTAMQAQFVDMETITEASSPEYAHVGVFGRPEPIRVYAGTSARDIPLTFIYHVNSPEDHDVIVKKAEWFEALKYPYKGNGKINNPPPTVKLGINGFLWMRSIVTQCRVSYGGGWTPKAVGHKPFQVTIQCVFSSCSDGFSGVSRQRMSADVWTR